MVHQAPPTPDGKSLDEISDAVDHVNVLKAKAAASNWDDQSQFDSQKDKAAFRDYENACERVKTFYREQHRKSFSYHYFRSFVFMDVNRETDDGVQHPGTRRFSFKTESQDERMGSDGETRPPR